MSHIRVLLQSILLFFATLAGGMVAVSRFSKSWRERLLSFGASYLFSTALLHVLPELFESVSKAAYPKVGICLVFGFYMQLFLDFISHGIAHNHEHRAHSGFQRSKSSGFFLLLSLCIHSFLEGIFMGGGEGGHFHGAGSFFLLISIILHKIPAAFSLTAALDQQEKSRNMIWASLILFALMTPIAWVGTSYLYHQGPLPSIYLLLISAVATGSMLHISVTILFESDPDHNMSLSKWCTILGGAVLPILLII